MNRYLVNLKELRKLDQTMGSGDVKYHMGFGSEMQTPDGKTIHLKLMPNPSHLEAVDPVVVGFCKKQSRYDV